MRLWLLFLVVGALPGRCEERALPDAPFAVYTEFEADPPLAVLEALQTELASVMPMGLEFQWRSLRGNRGDEVWGDLVVVTFKGSCDLSKPPSGEARPGPLGWTYVSDGVIFPFSYVDCDQIRYFVERDLQFLPAGGREEAFGRAVGRVLAHELYHIFAGTAHHAGGGLGKEAFTARELLSGNFRFQARESKVLLNRARAASIGKQ